MSTIWVIGASVRALAQSLTASGHRVIAADLFNDLDLQQVALRTQRIVDYPGDLLRLVDEVEADGFVYTGGLENEPDLIDELAKRMPLLGNPGHVLRRVRDPYRLRDVLASGGFEMPPMTRLLPRTGTGRWLRKSASSSGGLRVAWARSPHVPLHAGEYFQAFIEGPVYGASFRSSGGDVELLGIARQLTNCIWTNAPCFHYAGSVGPTSLSDCLRKEIERLGQFLGNEFQLRGWFGVDLVVDSHGRLYVLEVNPRYTASMELLQGRRSPIAAKAIFYADRKVCVTSDFCQRLLQRCDVADIPSPASQIGAGAPLCSLVADGASEDAVLARLQERAGEVAADVARLPTPAVAHR